jgi:hypothetical protein
MSPRTSPSIGAALVALAAALAIGCASRPFVPTTPSPFVDLGDKYGENEYRATTADGVVLSARSFDNDPKGPIDFWSRSVERRMREMGGYALLSKKEVQGAGVLQKGVTFRFGHDEGKQPFLYDLTLFVTGEHVYVLEAGGPKEEVEKQQAQIDRFVSSFRSK